MTTNTFLVTGAGRDIGSEIAKALASPDCFAVLHYAHSREGAEQTLADIRAIGGDGITVQGDFTQTDQIPDFTKRIVTHIGDRGLDLIVHNAAFTAASESPLTNPEEMMYMMNVNVITPFLLTDALLNHLNKQAKIIALSLAATTKVFNPNFGFFSATKAAMETIIQNWAVQLGPRQITVNGVAPGVVEVNFRKELLKNDAFRESLVAQTALSRAGQMADIVPVVQFLASPAANWVTGQVIEASGGWKL